ncbi:cell division cycle and apoptosis regulator protein 1-like [Musca autumnalis]|uniref:cell division cycle and apoptosis regulator protein 1-like n=1 Tax=Musca autumnalis TaxID=221902 RepID=UPI003CEAC799
MSFGGQSNAWQRNMMQGHPQSNSFQQYGFQNNMASQFHGGGGGGGGGGNMYPNSGDGGVGGGSVQYPIRTGLNPVAFQGSGVGGGGGMQQQNRHYNSIGTVTKINNDCGLVNNEVFFYRNVCKGPEPKLGDRVIFEASYSTSGQFKWNATQIQLMPSKPQMMNQMDANYGSPGPMSNDYARGGGGPMQRHPSPKRAPLSPIRHERERRGERGGDRHRRSWDREDDEHEWKRRREERERSRERNTSLNRGGGGGAGAARERERERERDSRRNERERERDPHRERERDRERSDRAERPERGERLERERERDREREKEREKGRDAAEKNQSLVPKGGRNRAIRRYMIQIPKHLLALKHADIQALRNRYSSLYIPSDFFHANIKWTDTFTPDNPFSLRRPCQFHLMDKNAESPFDQRVDELEPDDADYVYSAKVMLLSLPPIAEIYRKCFENNEEDLDHQPIHLSRIANFLVGLKGSKEPMAIGGPWSPSLDGENPDTDPSVLIRTAIRTCKALTNIDLSNCTQWYRFMELYYHRSEYKNMEKGGPPRVETVVIFLPDVHSCMPSVAEYNTMCGLYKATAEKIISRRAAAANKAIAAAPTNSDENNQSSSNQADESNAEANDENNEAGGDADENMDGDDAGDADAAEGADESNVDEEGNDENANESATADMDNSGVDDADVGDDTQQDNNDDDAGDDSMGQTEDHAADAADENEDPTPEPTHYSLLDLKNMKVQEIRDELLARDLSDKGVRNVVMARLAKALNIEKKEELKAKNREKFQKLQQQKGKKSSTTTADAEKDAKDDSKTDWADAIDFEMSDIVILDEYDASKNQEDKEMSEREKAKLMRRYTLPSTPQIVVHPNKLAKGGSFDCALMSLQVLMDYHHADTKERIFELSLFAELFNEMLMRDFAFNIYKEVHIYNSKEHSSEENAEAGGAAGEEGKTEGEAKPETTNNKTEEKSNKESEKSDDSKSRKRRTSTGNAQDSEKSDKPPPKRRMSTIDGREIQAAAAADDAKKTQRGETRDAEDSKPSSTDGNTKVVVAKPHLLLSFLFFDSTHCGYIFERDLEDLFMVVGLNLSRSQIKKVLAKIGHRSMVHYRKLTHKKEAADALAKIEDADDLALEELKDLASGNNKYEFVFGETHVNNVATPIDADGNSESDLVHYNGAVIHLGKLMEQIKRTEKELSDMEKLYNDLVKEHSDLQREQSKAKTKIKNLSEDRKSLKRKLTQTNQELYTLTRKYRDQNSTLLYIYTRVEPYFSKDKEEEKDKESSHKDKDDKKKDEKDAEKDKHKDKHTDKDHSKEKSKDSEKDKSKSEKEKESKSDKEKECKSEKESKPDNEFKSDKEKESKSDKEKESKSESKSVKAEKEEHMETETNEEATIKKETEKSPAKKEADEKQSPPTPKKETEKPKEEKKEKTPVKEETVEKIKEEEASKPAEEQKKETSAATKPATKPAQTVSTNGGAKATPSKPATAAAKATPAKPAAAAKNAPAAKATPAKTVANKPAGTPAKPAGTPAKTAAAKTSAATPAKPAGGAVKATPSKANPNVKKPAGTAANKKPNTDNSQK